MEPGFMIANSDNLPRVDVVMLTEFFSKNSSSFRNIKNSKSSPKSCGDKAVSYVQVKREDEMCIVKCKISTESGIDVNLYRCTLIVDEKEENIVSVKCEDCGASPGVCDEHAIIFLMWAHRRSEEPQFTPAECYWQKPEPEPESIKFITAKELSNGSPVLPENPSVLNEFLREARRRKINCPLLKYYPVE